MCLLTLHSDIKHRVTVAAAQEEARLRLAAAAAAVQAAAVAQREAAAAQAAFEEACRRDAAFRGEEMAAADADEDAEVITEELDEQRRRLFVSSLFLSETFYRQSTRVIHTASARTSVEENQGLWVHTHIFINICRNRHVSIREYSCHMHWAHISPGQNIYPGSSAEFPCVLH